MLLQSSLGTVSMVIFIRSIKLKMQERKGVILSKTRQKKEYCKKCRKETIHTLTEDALEINWYCHECHSQHDIVKTFF
ncbi:hypothetical protein AZK53_17740 [Priestia megaterium]|nr:hypothetical protein AZK53_17740 [Priestia megaterium]